LLLPAIARGRARANSASCINNLRQLFLANELYASEHGTYVPAAADLMAGNNQRWHGARTSSSEPFDGRKGPLSPYLGRSREIRACPAFARDLDPSAPNAFEAACGGYGYNNVGVGSMAYVFGFNRRAMSSGMSPSDLINPSATVMFADAAFPQPYGSPTHLVEYSFVEPYHFIKYNEPKETSGVASPSIHFRHDGSANVVWCDGHVSSEPLEVKASEEFTRFHVGWFGEEDNALFDPF